MRDASDSHRKSVHMKPRNRNKHRINSVVPQPSQTTKNLTRACDDRLARYLSFRKPYAYQKSTPL